MCTRARRLAGRARACNTCDRPTAWLRARTVPAALAASLRCGPCAALGRRATSRESSRSAFGALCRHGIVRSAVVRKTQPLRVASGRSVTIAVFVPLFLSIIYTVIVIIVIIMSVLRRERAVCDPTHRVRHSTLSLTKEREPEGPVPLCTCKSISRSPDPFETVPRDSLLVPFTRLASARTQFTKGKGCANVPPSATMSFRTAWLHHRIITVVHLVPAVRLACSGDCC